MAVMHEYTRTVVVRVKHRVHDDGGITAAIRIDADLSDRDTLLGLTMRVQRFIMDGGDVQHKEIKPDVTLESLGEIRFTEDEEE